MTRNTLPALQTTRQANRNNGRRLSPIQLPRKAAATQAQAAAPRMIPKSITDVMSENLLADSGPGLPRQQGQAATSNPTQRAHFEPQSAKPAVSPQGRPAMTSVAPFKSAKPTAPVISDHGPSQTPSCGRNKGDCPGANRHTAAKIPKCTTNAAGHPSNSCDVQAGKRGNPAHQCSVAAPTADPMIKNASVIISRRDRKSVV